MYLSPSTWHYFNEPENYGCMLNIVRPIGRQDEALQAGCWWMLDNGQYNDKWTWVLWWSWLHRLLPFRRRCLAIVVPDKMADAITTLHLFRVFAHVPRQLGYPVALVTQDGMRPADVPWPLLDVLFIGGSQYHKRGREAEALAMEAKRRGKWVHVGRVQAGSTMVEYWPWADSFDGTTLIRHRTQQMGSISAGVSRLRRGAVPYTAKLF